MLPIELESTNFKFGSWVVACNVLVDIEVCGYMMLLTSSRVN